MGGSPLSVALLRQRLVSLLDAMPAAQAGDEASVHAARVASRRLRGVLPVIGATIDVSVLGRARRDVRRITRALGPVREIDVSLSLLDDYDRRRGAPALALARVRESIAADRSARLGEMLAHLTPSRLERLRRRLVAVAAPAHGGQPGADETDEASRQTASCARRLRRAIEQAGTLYVPACLHRVRVAAKKLRYALEVRRALTRSRSLARVNAVKDLQDTLGRLHDLDVLNARTRAVQEVLPASDRRATGQLGALIRALERDGRAIHAAYLHARPTILTICADLVGSAETSHPAAVA